MQYPNHNDLPNRLHCDGACACHGEAASTATEAASLRNEAEQAIRAHLAVCVKPLPLCFICSTEYGLRPGSGTA